MPLEKQTSFRWQVSLDLFLAGTGGGMFFAAYLLEQTGRYKSLATIGTFLGLLLLLAGVFLLLYDLGDWRKAYRILANPSSWIARGAWCIALFLLFGWGYALPSLEFFSWLPWSRTTAAGTAMGAVAAIASLLVILYPGFLLGVIKRIPLWNTPVLPVLFFFSSLSTGLACLLLIGLFPPMRDGQDILPLLSPLLSMEIILILTEIVVLGAYLEVIRQGGVAAAASIRSLRSPLFIGGVLFVGLIIPLCTFLGVAVAGGTSLIAIGSLFLLIGGGGLRYAVIQSGIYLPLYTG